MIKYNETPVQFVNLDIVSLYRGERVAILMGRVNSSRNLRTANLFVGPVCFFSDTVCQKRATGVCSRRACSHCAEKVGMHLNAYVNSVVPFVKWEEAEFVGK